MLIISSWINEYLGNKLTVHEIISALEISGVEVESVTFPHKLHSNIKIAKVLSVEKHPNADRLRIVLVNVGQSVKHVVCGAPNVTKDQIVALALPGSVLSDGSLIENTKIRGEHSEGMLCSGKELGLNEDEEGILVLEDGLTTGKALNEYIRGDEAVIYVKTAANRSDLHSIGGLAREVAVHTRSTYKDVLNQKSTKNITNTNNRTLIKNKLPDLVNAYHLAHIRVNSSEVFNDSQIQKRLTLSGIQAKTYPVDLSNYLMLATGQPLHVFDASKVKLPIIVRNAKNGEKFKALNEKILSLSSQDIVIADSQNVLALAGVIGGYESGVDGNTTDILIESANFDALIIRRSALRHGIRTEASSRFERGLPEELSEKVFLYFINKFLAMTDSELVDLDVYKSEKSRVIKKITVDVPRFSDLAGIDISKNQIIRSLEALGFQTEIKNDNIVKVTVPYWRKDVTESQEIFEEVIKVVGLDTLPSTLPTLRNIKPHSDHFWPRLWELREVLRGGGLTEINTYPFVSRKQLKMVGANEEDQLKLSNPMSLEQSYLRPTLLPNLMTTKPSYEADNIKVFEFAKVFKPTDVKSQEQLKLGVYVASIDSYFVVKNTLDELARVVGINIELRSDKKIPYLHTTHQASIMVGDTQIGHIGDINPTLLQVSKIETASYLELDVNGLFELWKEPTTKPVSKFQAPIRDITIQVEEFVTWQSIKKLLQSEIYRIKYMGEYQNKILHKKRQRNITFRVILIPNNKNLTTADIESHLEAIRSILKTNFQAKIV